jgi:hypothetical protein
MAMLSIGRALPRRVLLSALLLAGLLAAGRGVAHAEAPRSSATQIGPISFLPACVACVPGDLTLVDLGPTTAPPGALPLGARLIDIQNNGGTPNQCTTNVQVKASVGEWLGSNTSLLTIPCLADQGGHMTATLVGPLVTMSVVTVDPQNMISETNENNNTITVKFS